MIKSSLSPFTLLLVRNSVNRQSPLGELGWMEKTAQELGLSSTLNPRGRPKKKEV